MPVSTKTFRVFVSSTFSDFIAERDALQSRVYPRLSALCQVHGANFQAVDLRWGVSERAAEDQRTIRICLREIDRCREMTPRPNFILLMGERYGWRPVPEQIPAAEFELISAYLGQQKHFGEKLRLLTHWYVRDDNWLPPLYELQSRQDRQTGYTKWLAIENKLASILRQASRKLNFAPTQLRRYHASATEQEIAHRGLLDDDPEDESVFLFFRQIVGLPADRRARQFRDLDSSGAPDMEAQAHLTRLKKDLRRRFFARTSEYRAHWGGTDLSNEHLEPFCDHVYGKLAHTILKQLAGQAEDSQLDAELRTHARFAEQRNRIFIGRKDCLRRIEDYLVGPAKFPLVIHGPSGSGKSTVMARALQLPGVRRLGTPIYRFIGAAAGSSNIRLLLASLCAQLRSRCGQTDPPPDEFSDLVRDFRDRLNGCASKEPVVIFIDALDQLYQQYEAHGLAWLRFDLPARVFMIVSCLPGDCLDSLQDKLPSQQFHRLDAMPAEDAELLLDRWLAEAGRCLQPKQRQTVREAFRNNGLPLYLRLIFEQARTWKSNHQPIRTAEDVAGLIRETFAALASARRHGPQLVELSLAYIASAKVGLSHGEIVEILSKDPQVMTEFRRRSPSSPFTASLPPIIWSRLYLDLTPYLTERQADGTRVLDFFHRQLRDVVQQDYLAPGVKEKRHRMLSDYFARQELFIEANGRHAANLRKLSEWPFQLRGAGDQQLLGQTLGNFRFLNAKVSAMGTAAVIEDFDLIIDSVDDAPMVDIVALKRIQACLRLASGVLSQDASQLPAQLHGRLAGQKNPLLQALLAESITRTASTWLRPLNTSLVSTGEALLTNYVFDRDVEVVAVFSDAANLLVGCDDGSIRLVNIGHRNEVRRLQLHTAAIIAIKPLPAARGFVSGSRDGDLVAWDIRGKVLSRRHAPVARLFDLDLSPEGNLLVAGGEGERNGNLSSRGIITVWDSRHPVEPQRWQVDPGSVSCLSLSPGGRILLCGTSHGRFQKWNLDDRRQMTETSLHDGYIFRISLLPDGKRALICSGDQSSGQYNLRLWDVENWRELHLFRHHRYNVVDVAVSPTGDRALSASHDQTICLWDLIKYKLIARLAGHGRQVRSVAIETAGDIAYSASGTNVYRWSLGRAVQTGNMPGHADLVHTVTASVAAELGVSAAGDGSIALWDLKGRQPRIVHRLQNPKIRRFCVSNDARTLFFAGDKNTINRTGIRDGIENTLFKLPDTRASALLCSETDDVLYVGCEDGSLAAWDLSRNSEIWRVKEAHPEPVFRLALSNQGQWLISAGDDFFLRAWCTADGARVVDVNNETGVPDLAAARNGTIVVTGTHYGRLHIWNAAKSELLWRLEHAEIGQNYSVTAVACSPDGRFVLSGGTDEMVHAWDTRTGTRIATFIAEDRSTCAHALGPRLFMLGSRNGAVHFLKLSAGADR